MSHFVNSEAIFSVIGDYPVTDQFDVSYSSLQAGSTHDNYITGSLLRYSTNFFNGKRTLVQGERGLIFSKLNVSQDSLPTGILDTDSRYFAGYYLQPHRERAGIIKNIKLFSNDERFYDSLLPSLIETFNILGGKIVKWTNFHNTITLDNDVFNPFEENTNASPVGFEPSFPFEPMFSNVKRNKRIGESFESTATFTSTGIEPSNPFKTKRLLIVELNSGSNFFTTWSPSTPGSGSFSFDANYWVDNLIFSVIPGVDFGEGTLEIETAKILFGFGDRNSIKIKLFDGVNYVVGRRNLVEKRFSIAHAPSTTNGNYLALGPVIRGWKYGLIDGNPHYTSCVFRRNSFGQLRDMLEQRPNSTFIHDENNSPSRYFGTVETPPIPPGDSTKSQISSISSFLTAPENSINNPPVRINFVRQSYIESTKELLYTSEKPENTWSSNLSPYATSSLPYFDDVSRNRNSFTIPPGSIVLTSLADLF